MVLANHAQLDALLEILTTRRDDADVGLSGHPQQFFLSRRQELGIAAASGLC